MDLVGIEVGETEPQHALVVRGERRAGNDEDVVIDDESPHNGVGVVVARWCPNPSEVGAGGHQFESARPGCEHLLELSLQVSDPSGLLSPPIAGVFKARKACRLPNGWRTDGDTVEHLECFDPERFATDKCADPVARHGEIL